MNCEYNLMRVICCFFPPYNFDKSLVMVNLPQILRKTIMVYVDLHDYKNKSKITISFTALKHL